MNVAIVGLSCLMYVTRGSAGQVMRSREAPPRLIVAATFHLGKDDTSAHEITWYS
jgi:hypothetical protein